MNDESSSKTDDDGIEMDYESVITRFGKFGRYQIRVYLVLILPVIACAFQKMGGTFLTAKADFRCLLPHEDPENSTYLLDYPSNSTTTIQCEKYHPHSPNQYNHTGENIFSANLSVKCDSFVYDDTHYTQTATTEWDLVCDNAWLKTLSDSVFMLGDMPGVIIWGALADKFGRKSALLWGSVVQLLSASLVAVSPNIYVFVVLRTLVGSTGSGLLAIAYVSTVEMATPQIRMKIGVSINVTFAIGYILSALLAYSIRTWRILQIVFVIPTLLLLSFWWSIPESVRWLLNKGRVEEARNILEKASSENGVKISRRTLDGLLNRDNKSRRVFEKTSLFDLLKYPNLRKKSLILFFIWFVNSIVYFGLSFNTSNLGGNDYVNFASAAIVELPAYAFLMLSLDRWGRRYIMCGSLLLAGTSLLATYAVPRDMSWLLKVLAMIGKFGISSAWATVYIASTEQYPTAVRTVGIGACSAIARIAGAIAPYINYLFDISTYLPFTLLGICSFIAGLLSLLLPETLHKNLPDSILDGEDLEKIANSRKSARENRRTVDDVDVTKPLRKKDCEMQDSQ